MRTSRREFLGSLAAARMLAAEGRYDPLVAPDEAHGETIDLSINDAKRKREIPLRVYLPAAKAAAPVVLFSHGLGGSREGSPYLGRHWSGRGYLAVFLQHKGSDTDVWRGKPVAERMAAMRAAAGLDNFMLRVKDVPAVLDELERWNGTAGHALAGRMDLKRVGMSGHSFGAVTTQAVTGQRFARGGALFTDRRIGAAVMMSPSCPRAGSAEDAFGAVKVPWLLMTGTRDVAPVGDADVESRLKVFPALPAGGKYELVLDRAEHSAFSDGPLPGDVERRNPNHHRVILALSTAFWDEWLRGDGAAKAWLEGGGPAGVMEKGDRWRKK